MMSNRCRFRRPLTPPALGLSRHRLSGQQDLKTEGDGPPNEVIKEREQHDANLDDPLERMVEPIIVDIAAEQSLTPQFLEMYTIFMRLFGASTDSADAAGM